MSNGEQFMEQRSKLSIQTAKHSFDENGSNELGWGGWERKKFNGGMVRHTSALQIVRHYCKLLEAALEAALF